MDLCIQFHPHFFPLSHRIIDCLCYLLRKPARAALHLSIVACNVLFAVFAQTQTWPEKLAHVRIGNREMKVNPQLHAKPFDIFKHFNYRSTWRTHLERDHGSICPSAMRSAATSALPSATTARNHHRLKHPRLLHHQQLHHQLLRKHQHH